jgi:hypothetical protein
MRGIGKDSLAVRSEMLADDHDKASKKTNESVEDLLAESFVVRKVGQSRNHPPRIMISAAAVINRAREMAKEAGEKSHGKFIKLAHAEIASNMKAESVEEFDQEEINEISLKTKIRAYASRSASDFENDGWDAKNNPDRIGDNIQRKHGDAAMAHADKAAHAAIFGRTDASGKHKSRTSSDSLAKPAWDVSTQRINKNGKINKNDTNTLKYKIKNNTNRVGPKVNLPEEFVQYEDAITEALQAIKEDCRVEALSMSDSLLEAQQLASELFEDIVQEYLDEALVGRMSDMSKYTHPDIENSKPFNYAEWKASGVKPRKPRGYKEAEAIGAAQRKIDQTRKTNEEVEELDEATHQELLDGAQKAYIEATRKGNGVMAKHYGQEILKHKANIARAKKLKLKEEVEELDEMEGAPYTLGGKVDKNKVYKVHRQAHNGSMEHNPDDTYHSLHDAKRVAANMGKSGSKTKITIHDRTKLAGPIGKLPESVEDLDEAALSGDAYWKAKEAESKEEFLKAQRKALGLPEPVKRGRGKPTLIDRDLLKTRAHSNVEAGKRPTAGFDRNEKIHFVRHLKNHPDFADKHVSQAGRPTGTTKVAKEQKDLAKKKQDSAFSMWAGLGKRS